VGGVDNFALLFVPQIYLTVIADFWAVIFLFSLCFLLSLPLFYLTEDGNTHGRKSSDGPQISAGCLPRRKILPPFGAGSETHPNRRTSPPNTIYLTPTVKKPNPGFARVLAITLHDILSV